MRGGEIYVLPEGLDIFSGVVSTEHRSIKYKVLLEVILELGSGQDEVEP